MSLQAIPPPFTSQTFPRAYVRGRVFEPQPGAGNGLAFSVSGIARAKISVRGDAKQIYMANNRDFDRMVGLVNQPNLRDFYDDPSVSADEKHMVRNATPDVQRTAGSAFGANKKLNPMPQSPKAQAQKLQERRQEPRLTGLPFWDDEKPLTRMDL